MKEIVCIGQPFEELRTLLPLDLKPENPNQVKHYRKPDALLKNKLTKPGWIILGQTLSELERSQLATQLQRMYPKSVILPVNEPQKDEELYRFFKREHFFPSSFHWDAILHWSVIGVGLLSLFTLIKGYVH